MKKLFFAFLLTSLTIGSFNDIKPITIVDQNTRVALSTVATVVVGVASYYLIYKYLKNHNLPVKPDEVVLQNIEEKEIEPLVEQPSEEDKNKNSKLAVFLSTVPTVSVGAVCYFFLGQFSKDFILDDSEQKCKNLEDALRRKFNNGKINVFDNIVDDATFVNTFVKTSCGQKTRCPLVDAEKYLRNQSGQLVEIIEILQDVKDYYKKTDFAIEKLSEKASTLHEKIAKLLHAIETVDNNQYREQQARYDEVMKELRKEEIKKNKDKNDFIKSIVYAILINKAINTAGDAANQMLS